MCFQILEKYRILGENEYEEPVPSPSEFIEYIIDEAKENRAYHIGNYKFFQIPAKQIANLCNQSRIVDEAKSDDSRSKYLTSKRIRKQILNSIRANIK